MSRATLRLRPAAERDLQRFVDFLIELDPCEARKTLRLTLDALLILEDHPEAGRPVEAGLRELMISRGRTGYVALYVYDEISDEVWVLGVRHQREAGYGI
ncbi:MAG: type II toxin-antitoxin system RelE/ParE family toxin [Xanthomonadaceae bacterium]|jgi:plasmid stabilization system protein ParE|nr:type II toxin-antitoxin system RelE/ParE family toxin [Xanthomonadaceae bacterium]